MAPRRECRVFDDLLSLLHFAAGLAAGALGLPTVATLLFIIVTVYEVIEGRYRRDCPGADIIEFLAGLGAGAALRAPLSQLL